MKKLSLVLLFIFVPTLLFSQKSVLFRGTYEEAKIKAQKENKLILIDFFQYG